MTDTAVVVELLLARLREAHEILRELIPFVFNGAPWPVSLRLNLLDFFVRQRRYQRGLPSVRETEEALGLLMMLRHLNFEEWVAHVQEIWPDIGRERIGRDGGGHETFGVVVMIGVDHGFAELQYCHEQRQALGQSVAYQQVLQQVQGLSRGQEEWQSPKIAVQLFVFRRDQRSSLRLLGEISKMYRRDDPAPIFSITRVCHMQPELNLGVEELSEIAAFHEEGLGFYPFRLASCRLPQAQFRHQLLTVLQQLFAVSADTQLEAQGVNHLTISNSTPSYWIPALLSAVHSSKSLKSIQVESTFAELRETKSLLWIAYAVFRRQHEPLQLTLNCSHIEPSDVEAIRRIISAKDPLRDLVDGNMTSAAKEVAATQFHLADSTDSASSADDVYTSPYPLTVRVIEASVDGDRPTRVLLPGYGEAWLSREDVLNTGLEQRRSADVKLPDAIGVKSITATSSHTTMVWLRVVMPGVTRLEVGFANEVTADHIDAWLHQLLTISTDIQELQIKARTMRSLDVFLEGFTTRSLRLRKLEIENIVSGDGDHVRRFFDALGDRRHRIAEHIQHLQMTVVVASIEGYDFVESIQRMLRLNRCLTVFRIRICTISIPADANDAIREVAGEETLTFPMAIKQKTAFLSVVMSSSSTCSSVSQLNTSVIGNIFEFSASVHKRNVSVEVMVVPVGFAN